MDLIYIDPPFYSQKYYEVIWNENAERYAFEDRWSGGRETYISYLAARIRKMRDKLRNAGVFWIHLDWHIAHYMKIELDKIFGSGNLQNEIIWQRTSAHSDSKRFGHVHDTLFMYSKSDTFTWNPQYVPHKSKYLDTFYRFKDKRGRYRLHEIIRTASMGPRPNLSYEYKGYKPEWGWRVVREKLEAIDTDGRVEWSRTGRPYLKRYLKDMKGTALTSIWTDIIPVQAHSKERIGYPTQKPLALLQRIIRATSNPGDAVMDCFCGCGTTMEAAQKLNRNWLGIDISHTAIRVVQDRLAAINAPAPEVFGMVESIEQLRLLSPFEFQNWAINAVQGRHSPRRVSDMGIDGFTFLENHPIQVKKIESVGRPEIDKLVGVLEREKDKRGMLIALGFSKGAKGEAARLKRESGIEIELITCQELLSGISAKKIA